ncbi:guanine nucleotide-releasing factor 2 isoform X2 [Anopheles bellator]|uniref:guanine nucleotide-releasing factor 2 isoform X2 n=1 Tax=Anopheles bellator TaxID=139047 RepID=UPI00264A1864|nr:guanine nucleotide-releasing factor 2 isoform X2 [Anopheles bellator]
MATSRDERTGTTAAAINGYDNSPNSSTNPGATSTPVSVGRNAQTGCSANGSSSVCATPISSITGDQNSCNVTLGMVVSSGHKGSIRGNKLARRARSFKDDFLEKISQIRTPTNTMTRSHSPNNPRTVNCSRKSTADEPTRPVQDLNYHVRQVKNALTHFKDVILKNKLEMLPGNGTVVLESIANVHTALQSYTLDENSTPFINATNHVYISLGNLLKLCDEVLLTKDGEDCPSLSKENVKEVIELVENAVTNLVNLANEKLSDRDGSKLQQIANSNTLQRPTVDVVGQRTSLPDIPLTPRERDILEQTSLKTVRTSHSTESILRDASDAPPKPPLPDRRQEPPPLPPKRRSQHSKNHSFHDTSDCNSESTYLGCGALDRMSLRSRSPEDNSSLLSASAGSLDSALNHSRDEDELRTHSAATGTGTTSQLCQSSNPGRLTLITMAAPTWDELPDNSVHGVLSSELAAQNNRNSNESGFESMYSLRVSRDHQHVGSLTIAQQNNATAHVHRSESVVDGISELRCSMMTVGTKIQHSSHHHQHHNQMHVLQHQHNQQQHYQHQQVHQKIDTIITQASDESVQQEGTSICGEKQLSEVCRVQTYAKNSLSKMMMHNSVEEMLANDDVFPYAASNLDRPPALPVKTRSHSIKKERHLSQYDNVDDSDVEKSSQDALGHCSKQSSPSYLQTKQQIYNNISNKHISLIEPRHMNRFQEEPPPLPIKKKHMFQSVAYSVMAYMEIFGSATQNHSEFTRHSVHTYNPAHSEQVSTSSNQSISHSQTMSLSPSRIASVTVSPPNSPNVNIKPPALPPKRQRINSKTPSIASTPPASPKIFQDHPSCQPQSPLINASSSSLTQKHNVQILACSKNLDVTSNNSFKAKVSPGHLDTAIGALSVGASTYNTPTTELATATTITTSDNSFTSTPYIASDSNTSANFSPETNVRSCELSIMTNFEGAASNNSKTVNSIKKTDDTLFGCHVTKIDSNNSFLKSQTVDYLHLCDTTTTNLSTSNTNLEANHNKAGNTLVNKHSQTNNTSVTSSMNSNYLFDQHNKISGSSSSCKLKSTSDVTLESPTDHDENNKDGDEVEVVLRRNNKNCLTLVEQQQPCNLMEELDVSTYLVFKKENEDGPDVKGGHPDALIIHATRVQKNSDAYGEAFITTFRTFISPLELIQKLSHRYTVHHCQLNDAKQKAAKESFSLLVRVVNDLTAPDLTERLLIMLMNFKYQLVSGGHLNMAKLLRVKLIEKVLLYKQKSSFTFQTLSSRAVVTSQPSLLDLKSAEIAEQMTLLDAELFLKIEIPEVLIWAQEQCEERSPNLTRFTEHFNKMSYWARTQILSQNDAKDREKHVIKFIKIMKHLRKINNYNSYLALLSALDSAPIRRLEWHKTITEGLKEYCALIDSSSSFRAYRQALAETNPPCIPYIGLVLQDLTFVHIGNPDLLPDGSTNFSKRWQQYHIVVNMKRFKKGSYPFKKNDRIIGFFENFENYLDEDAMWQISENIKPRGTRKNNVN